MLMPASPERERLLEHVARAIDRFIEETPSLRVAPDVTAVEIRRHLESYDFRSARPAGPVLDDAIDMLTRWSLHVTHPRYFGLFNPTPSFMGILADALAAAFNSQIAAWAHSPAGNEIERHVLTFLGMRLGLPASEIAGTFTSGGTEANFTGVLLALTRAFPDLAESGVRGLPGEPVFYASEESHHSLVKIAQQCGLGRRAVRLIPVCADLRMDPGALESRIAADRARGDLPFLVVGTAGTTSAGVVDPLADLACICERERLSFHVDAAWGGAAALSDRLRPVLAGIERADSITVDAHKWLSVPNAGGMFLCRSRERLHETFRVSAAYVPPNEEGTMDPYANGVQWSRRFIGLKLFLTLAVAGEPGYAQVIEHQAEIGEALRRKLVAGGWRLVNETPLPLVCFADGGGADADAIVRDVVRRGRAWVSTTRLRGEPAIRACITSYRTTEEDLDVLVEELGAARRDVRASREPANRSGASGSVEK
ncbi:MAG: pyridoxal-dependent decarboxylase [Planctomycetes bacterium]|nr:pyridoxal-dependent decarboxylase [Planctomycetota bacterium]